MNRSIETIMNLFLNTPDLDITKTYVFNIIEPVRPQRNRGCFRENGIIHFLLIHPSHSSSQNAKFSAPIRAVR